MKIPHASLLAAVTLSLALCACDNGDKKDKDSGAATPMPPTAKTPKPPKTEDSGTAANPQPPESNEAPKAMNAPSAPGEPGAAPTANATDALSAIERINGAIKMYTQKAAADMMIKMGPGAGGGDANSAKAKYLANAKKTPAGAGNKGLTSLDQLVTAGFLKSIPEAPAGKKFVLDPKTQEVRLENK